MLCLLKITFHYSDLFITHLFTFLGYIATSVQYYTL